MVNNLTLVTCLFDINRDALKSGFDRSFDHYTDCFRRLLATPLPMVIFCDHDVEDIVWQERSKKNTHVVHKTIDDLKAFPFHAQTNAIRTQNEWRTRSTWIHDSPQSQLELYNPLVMSKQFFLNDATIYNFFDTKYFLWIDAGISNTIGDPVQYLNDDFSQKISRHLRKMLYVCFPYDGKVEVHGFEKTAFNRFAGQETDRVARGGMFGGTAYAINQVNSIYYQLLGDTLNAGFMGTEENIFTLITYLYPELCHILWIESNGLIAKALEDIKSHELRQESGGVALYVLTYNLPEQFDLWIASCSDAFPDEFDSVAKYVINNSDDGSVKDEYTRLIETYGFKEFPFENIGICGGRQVAAEHFAESEHEYMIFFEDDMLLHAKPGACPAGFTTYHPHLFEKCIHILECEELDYLKLSFSEFYGNNHENWAWHNVPEKLRHEYFPPTDDGTSPRATVIKRTGSYRGLPYAVGEYHYCNWPILFNKKGNEKVFLKTRFEHKFEQTWMSHVMTLIKAGEVSPGALLASPVYHHRKFHYDGNKRRENEHS